ncbi:MAG: hypothetical protein J6W03_09645 [Bacteroidaceae bacterium]|nr:hypothetical protein [Bacteroidaceae bacterium]
MRKTAKLQICLFVLAALMCLPAEGAVRKRKTQARRNPDTLVVAMPSPEMRASRKMSTSAYPVQINVTGRVVQVQSDHNQLLPIYNQNGVLYLTARLNKGKNWLGGLPRGRYFINNRPITIN